MRASCVICSDIFDGVVVTVVAHCGHIFHERCLISWLDQSSTCPECRGRVTKKSLIKLYFNISTDEELSAGSLENKISSLTSQLLEKNAELAKIRDEKEQIKGFVTIAEERVSALQQEMYPLKSEVTVVNLALKDARKKAAKVDELQSQNLALMRKIELFNNINTVIQGTQKDVEDVLKTIKDEPNAAKNLATSCSLLKRELKNAVESKQQLKSEIVHLRKHKGFAKANLGKLTDQVKQLQEQVQSLEKENLELVAKSRQAPASSVPSHITVIDSPVHTQVKNPVPIKSPDNATDISNKESEKYKKRRVGLLKYEISEGLTSKPVKQLKRFENDLEIVYSSYEGNDENSLIRYGYNGLGGHSKFINSAKNVTITRPLKK